MRRWEAQDRNETKVERGYIVEEARTLFRENKQLRDEQEIRLRMMEAEARLTMAEHYGERGRRSLRKIMDLGLVTILRGIERDERDDSMYSSFQRANICR